jgi:DNA-binding MarR family transcriptional regulator
MPRRRSEKPVERLRSSWTSTADLEETIAAMFQKQDDTLPGDSQPQSPVKLSSINEIRSEGQFNKNTDYSPYLEPVNLTGVIVQQSPDKLAAVDRDTMTGDKGESPPVNLTAGAYQTLQGAIVDAKCIRYQESVQSAHTPSEQAVYAAMWRMLGPHDGDPRCREGILAMVAIANKVGLSLRNLRRILRSLEQKLAIEVTEFEDKKRSIPRRYRVWGAKPTVERRRQAGYCYVYRNRNLITLARSSSFSPAVKMTGDCEVNLTGDCADKLSGVHGTAPHR